MKVLVACEFSGVVRDAFIRGGHEAMSCDLLPTDVLGPHYKGDVMDIIGAGWDLMIAHPPCTFLSRAANQVWNAPGRADKRQEAFEFFMMFVNAPIAKICIENPVGYANTAYRKPDQIIHPYYFGERHLKKTCLWLSGLPKIWYWPVDDLFGKRTMTDYPEPIYIDKTPRKKKRYFTDAAHGGHARSRSFDGIAQAMAQQWGSLAFQHCVNSDVGDSATPRDFIYPVAGSSAQALSAPAPRGLR